MTPTMQLRWLKRRTHFETGQITIPDGLKVMGYRDEQVLQQFWEASFYEKSVGVESEWRDVPMEVEN